MGGTDEAVDDGRLCGGTCVVGEASPAVDLASETERVERAQETIYRYSDDRTTGRSSARD